MDITDFVAEPLTALRRARQTGWLTDLDAATGVLTHEDVRALLADPRLHSNFPEFLRTFGVDSGPFYDWMAGSPLNREGDEHLRWRSLVSRAFTPRSVERIRPYLRDAAHEVIDGFAGNGACEFVAAFADAYPSLGLCELIGVPRADRDRFRGWANTIGIGFSPLALATRLGEGDDALVQLLAYARELAAARRAEPRDDLVTRIAQAADEAKWTEDEVPAAIAGLVFAGHETTQNQLGWMIAVLADHPTVWEAVAAGTLAVAPVVEEAMRHRSAVTSTGRTAAEPVEHKGERFAEGERVLLSLWSADHDEAAYAEPEHFDPAAHGDVPHLAFGHGAHFCLGAALARAELQEALAALTARLGPPTLEDGATWKLPMGITGPERLPITFSTPPRLRATRNG
jgi:cytochrome P450